MNIADRLLEIELGYNTQPTPEQIEKLNSFIGREVKLLPDGTLSYSEQDHQLTITEALSLGLPFTVKSATNLARWTPA